MVGNNFLKHDVLLLAGILQFLLDKPGAMLIGAELPDVAK
jgi:hypothetical protein